MNEVPTPCSSSSNLEVCSILPWCSSTLISETETCTEVSTPLSENSSKSVNGFIRPAVSPTSTRKSSISYAARSTAVIRQGEITYRISSFLVLTSLVCLSRSSLPSSPTSTPPKTVELSQSLKTGKLVCVGCYVQLKPVLESPTIRLAQVSGCLDGSLHALESSSGCLARLTGS